MLLRWRKPKAPLLKTTVHCVLLFLPGHTQVKMPSAKPFFFFFFSSPQPSYYADQLQADMNLCIFQAGQRLQPHGNHLVTCVFVGHNLF